jgi:16S rRNA (cytosine1402-N4)-methyltransferase
MRFGPKSGELTGKEIVNTWNESELIKIFKIYGEEKNAIGIAKEIIRRRKIKPIVYSDELAEIVLQFYREKFKTKKRIPWVGGRHPATKIFQAIRIAVNDEINNLKSVLPQAIDILEKDGRLCVISFHSLEDRIVKKFFKQTSVACDFGAGKLKILTKKPIRPSEEEIQQNPRSRSARLRVAQKL